MHVMSTWTGKASGLALVAAMGIALVTAMGTTGDTTTLPALGGSAACVGNDDSGYQTPRIDTLNAADACQDENVVRPAAVCRLRPECSTNEECDAACGVGLGKCIHNKCPVRICSCR